MRSFCGWYCLGGLIGILVCTRVGIAQPLIYNTFEDNDGTWLAMGPDAAVSRTHDDANVKEGHGALRFDYSVEQGSFGALVLATEAIDLSDLKSIKFWIKSDHAAPFGFVFQEKQEGRYIATFWVPKDKWQEVQLSPGDSILSDLANGPKDPDGKLDLEKIQGVGIVDLSQAFAQSDNAQLRKLFNVSPGPHTLYLDEFSADTDALPKGEALSEGQVAIDPFVHPQAGWMAVGESQISMDPFEAKLALCAEYHRLPGKLVGWIRPVAPGALSNISKINIRCASVRPAKLLVQVEETDGGKYRSVVDLAGGSRAQELSVELAGFQPSNDSNDQNNKLDTELIKQVMIMDLTGMSLQAEDVNKIWISSITATK